MSPELMILMAKKKRIKKQTSLAGLVLVLLLSLNQTDIYNTSSQSHSSVAAEQTGLKICVTYSLHWKYLRFSIDAPSKFRSCLVIIVFKSFPQHQK